VVSIIQPLVERTETTFHALQGINTLFQEQRPQYDNLVCDISRRLDLNGPADEKFEFELALEENSSHGFLDRNIPLNGMKCLHALMMWEVRVCPGELA
jgi:hypothetical protein